MRIFLLFGFFLSALLGISQMKPLPNDTQWLHRCFYPNHRWSAYSYILHSTGNGKAICFNLDGKIMFESDISRNHGHHSVHFEHHPNWVVRKIEESQAPDAGIQWYRSEYYFDEKGLKTGESHDSYDERPTMRMMETINSMEQQVSKCSVIYSNLLMIENRTGFTISVTFINRGKSKTATISPNQKYVIDTVIQAGFFKDPLVEGKLELNAMNTKRKTPVTFLKTKEAKINKDTMMYSYLMVSINQLSHEPWDN